MVLGQGAEARLGERVVVHYEAKWKGVTFMSEQAAPPWGGRGGGSQGGRGKGRAATGLP